MKMSVNATGAGMSMSMMKGTQCTGNNVGKDDETISNAAKNQSGKIMDTYEQGSTNALLVYNQTGNIVK